MILKKIALVTATLVVSGLPVLANALSLVTQNDTNFPSTVKITTSIKKLCSSQIPNGVTPPHKSLVTPQSNVNMICMGSPNHHCMANLYASANCGDDAGVYITTLGINQDTLFVDQPGAVTPGYKVTVINTAGVGSKVIVSQTTTW